MIDRRIHPHDAGVRNKAPGRLDADHAGERRGNADRAGLVAAGRHIDFAGGDECARPGRGAARRMAPGPRIVNRTGNAGRRAAREGEIFADRFADDLGAGIKKPRDHRRVEFRHETLEHRCAIGQRHAGERIGVLYRHFLARELAAAGALDARLGDPGAVFVFVAHRPVIGATRVFHHRHVIRQRCEQPVAIAKRPDEVDERIGVVLGHLHAETVTQFADLIRRRHLKRHRIFPPELAEAKRRNCSSPCAWRRHNIAAPPRNRIGPSASLTAR